MNNTGKLIHSLTPCLQLCIHRTILRHPKWFEKQLDKGNKAQNF